MGDEILCIDGSFVPEALLFYKEHGVSTPQRDKIYTIREVVKHTMGVKAGEIGLLLNELKNPEVPIWVGPLGSSKREPTWSINRFAHLDGSQLTEEEVKEWDRVYNLTKNLNF